MFFATLVATNTPNSLQAKLLYPDQQRPLGLRPEAVEYAEHLLGAEGARAHNGIASYYALFAYPIIRRTRVISWFDPSGPAEGSHSPPDCGFCDGQEPARHGGSSPLLLFPARRAFSAAIKRSSQSASDRASFCASSSAMALTDGFMRPRIATKRVFGFGFFIGPTLERSTPALCR
jgi:hypothetical protein